MTDANGETMSSVFDRTTETWPRPTGWPPTLAPVLYVRLDGQFSLWDPLRNRGTGATSAYHFESLWKRLVDDTDTVLCNGLVDDWRDWSQRDDKSLFMKFFGVIKALMPSDEGPTAGDGPEPAGVVKMSKRSATRVPQIRLRYGDIPIEHLSAGMKRILGIAYLLVWAWDEHVQAARLEGTAPATQIVLLIDEVEAHLHPKWQRMLVPALIEAAQSLAEEHLSVQLIATTHSPLVVASLEPHFDPDTDQLLHMGYEGDQVRAREISWANHGDASAWLESPAFELERSTNPELERVLEAARDVIAHAFARQVDVACQVGSRSARVGAAAKPRGVVAIRERVRGGGVEAPVPVDLGVDVEAALEGALGTVLEVRTGPGRTVLRVRPVL